MSVNIPIVNKAYLAVSGLQISWASGTTLTVQAGSARNSTNVNDIVSSASVTINAAVIGINGIDAGALANSTLYGIYAVGDSTYNSTSGFMLSASLTAPTVPANYDMIRLIGYVRTSGAAAMLLGYWSGSANDRMFSYDAPIATAITAGAATTDTEVILDTFVPPTQGLEVLINYVMTPAAASRTLTLKPYGATGVFFQATSQVTSIVVRGTALVQAQLNAGKPSLEYLWSAGGGDAVALNVAAYNYSI